MSSANKYAYNPPDMPLQVIYEDSDLLVLSKPSGLLSVPGKIDHRDSLELRAREEYPDVLLVHRLDLGTSGIMLMARNPAAQTHLSKQFMNRTPKKHYIARVWGQMKEQSGHVDLPLICDWPNRPRQKVCYEHGKDAKTDWEVIGRDDISTRVKLVPQTGRSHQLRMHMKEIGYPILGDELYAPDDALSAADRLQLHAESLTVQHPASGNPITFNDECPF